MCGVVSGIARMGCYAASRCADFQPICRFAHHQILRAASSGCTASYLRTFCQEGAVLLKQFSSESYDDGSDDLPCVFACRLHAPLSMCELVVNVLACSVHSCRCARIGWVWEI